MENHGERWRNRRPCFSGDQHCPSMQSFETGLFGSFCGRPGQNRNDPGSQGRILHYGFLDSWFPTQSPVEKPGPAPAGSGFFGAGMEFVTKVPPPCRRGRWRLRERSPSLGCSTDGSTNRFARTKRHPRCNQSFSLRGCSPGLCGF